MQCHLGRCLPFPLDVPLEAFTRRLASEDADEQLQRLVPAIARTALPSASTLSL